MLQSAWGLRVLDRNVLKLQATFTIYPLNFQGFNCQALIHNLSFGAIISRDDLKKSSFKLNVMMPWPIRFMMEMTRGSAAKIPPSGPQGSLTCQG